MTIFGLDSAGKTAGIAILRDSRLIYECYLATGHTHSETLLCLCKNAFDAAGLSPAEIDVFAAAAGPGSFTGLRIGLAAVKGLAFPHDTPCAAVSTLEALAYSAAVEGTLLCALDARRGEVYWAGFFAADGAVERLCPDESAPAASLRGFVESAREPVWLLGDGAQLVDEALNGTGKTRLYPEAYRLGRAGGVCGLRWQRVKRCPLHSLSPITTAFRRRSGNGRRVCRPRPDRAKDKKHTAPACAADKELYHMEKPVALGADHGGFALKEAVRAHLDERGVPYVDYGTHSEASVDYPDMAVPPCEAVVRGECACALLFCGTGVGISMAANKLDGIRACCCSDAFSAKYTRLHNDANALCLGGRVVGPGPCLRTGGPVSGHPLRRRPPCGPRRQDIRAGAALTYTPSHPGKPNIKETENNEQNNDHGPSPCTA